MIEVPIKDLEIIKRILTNHLSDNDYEVRAFGSRVNNHPKEYSDLDLVIVGTEKIPFKTLFALKEEFEESDLLFRIDLLDWHRISSEFRQVIEKNYEVINVYKKTPPKN